MKQIYFVICFMFFSFLLALSQDGKFDGNFAGRGWTFVDMPKGNFYDEFARKVLLQKDNTFIVVITINGFTELARYLPNGELDKSYGVYGYSFAGPMSPSSAAQQSDGKIVVFGSSGLIRYQTDGQLDKTFGNNGIMHTSFGLSAGVIQSDGKIVVAGSAMHNCADLSDFALSRFNPNGSIDKTFGNNGNVFTDFGNRNDFAKAMAIQKDGKIAVVGVSDPNEDKSDFAIARYNSDGSLDKTFKGDGKVNIDFGGSQDAASAVAIQEDQKIIVAGFTSAADPAHNGFALVRYNPDGARDKSFGGGQVITSFPNGSAVAYTLAIQNNGKIVAGGSVGGDNFALARYNLNGSLDNSFNGIGKVITDFGGDDVISSIAIQNNGKIVAAGSTKLDSNSNGDIAIARYNSNGSLDNTFSNDGKAKEFYILGASVVNAIGVQNDGKVVTGGYTYDANDKEFIINLFALARYKADGSLDNTFGEKGIVTTRFNSIDQIRALAIQKNGKIVAAGSSADFANDHVDFAIARYNTDGSLDSTFGNHGKVRTQFLDEDRANSVAIQDNGKIVVAGFTYGSEDLDIAIARYNTDGSLDETFGEGGRVIKDVSDGYDNDNAKAVAIQSNGKILITGETSNSALTGPQIVLIRFNSNGSLDNSFGNKGLVITNIRNGVLAKALAIQTDQKIVVAGNTNVRNYTNSDFILLRYLANGSLDQSFGSDGKVVTDFRTIDEASALGIQSDGKLIVAGGTGEFSSLTNFHRLYDFAFARYNPDGSLDKSFSDDGKTTKDFGGSEFATSLFIDHNRLYVAGKPFFQSPALRGILAAIKLGDIKPSNNNNQYVVAPAETITKPSVIASPNPSNSYFTLFLQSQIKGTVTIAVVDEIGRIVETKTGLHANSSIQIGQQYPKGVYYIKVTQGNNITVLKLIKNSD